MKNSTRTQKLALCGVLTALAMIFGYIESVISVPLPVPGIKVGLPNIAIITILYVVGIKEAVAVNLIRITLTAVLFGNLNSFLFSMSGAVLSMIIMIILKRIQFFSSVGVSVAGGVFHNIGQIIAAVFIMGSGAIVYYLPVLMITGTVTGAVIGIVSAMVVKRTERAYGQK
ncbi:Gx transporter family protein [Lachnospira hominis (ex Hitch et al. 2024)]|uniref:Gx transporter family protein n=1 Tax=Lachnospira intestinalis TaxID=3133158 RepID=A0ABV1GRD5_9FIRM